MHGNPGGEKTPGGGQGWILNDLVTHSKKIFLHFEDSKNTFNDLKQGHVRKTVLHVRKTVLIAGWEVDY